MITVAAPAYICTNPNARDSPNVAVLSALPAGGSAGLMSIVVHFSGGIFGSKVQEIPSAPIIGHLKISPSCASFVIKMSVVVPDQDVRLCQACRKYEVKSVRYSWSPDRHEYLEVSE